MTNEERVTQLLAYLGTREDEESRSACNRLDRLLVQVRGGIVLAIADQAWLDAEWERFCSARHQPNLGLRRGQYFGETL